MSSQSENDQFVPPFQPNPDELKACPTGEELHKVWCRGSYVWAAVSDAEKLRWQQLGNIVATLQRRAEEAEDMVETMKRLDCSTLPCGHNSQYGYSPDGVHL